MKTKNALILLLGILTSVFLLLGCGSNKTGEQKVEKPVEDQKPSQSPEAQKESPTSDTLATREKLLTLVKEQSQDPQVYFQLGLSYYEETQTLSNPERDTLENLYKQAIENLEMAHSLFEEDKQPLQLYQALWESYRNLAYLPVMFNQSTDPDQGVVPLNMKYMKKAVEIYKTAKTKYPSDPAVASEIGGKLETDLKDLEAIYVANVQRQWDEMNEAGYRRPETYQERGHQ